MKNKPGTKGVHFGISNNVEVIVTTRFGETISTIGKHQIKFNTPFITHGEDLLNQIRRDQKQNKTR